VNLNTMKRQIVHVCGIAPPSTPAPPGISHHPSPFAKMVYVYGLFQLLASMVGDVAIPNLRTRFFLSSSDCLTVGTINGRLCMKLFEKGSRTAKLIGSSCKCHGIECRSATNYCCTAPVPSLRQSATMPWYYNLPHPSTARLRQTITSSGELRERPQPKRGSNLQWGGF
jgi:hypothetical protein